MPKRRTLLDAGKDFLVPTDPINNAEMADLWGRIASAVAGRDCRIVLQPGGFATDMHGTIYADPYPLGKSADPRHNLIVTKGGIYHEIGHELTTPPEDWAFVLAVAAGEETVAGIDQGRAMVPKLYNIIEDGRMERDMSERFPGVAETLAAQSVIYPRWGEQVGPGVPLAEEVIWPLLYTALPYFSVREEVRGAMTPEGRALFEELEPIARRGALGTPEDSLVATLEIARRLEAAGIFEVPATSATPPPHPGQGTPRRGPPGTPPQPAPPGPPGDADAQPDPAGAGSGADEAGADGDGTADAGADGDTAGEAEAGAATNPGRSANGPPAGPEQGRKPPSEDEPVRRGDGGGAAQEPDAAVGHVPVTPVGAAITPERLEDILNDLEAQAVGAVDREIARQGRYDLLGAPLHAPLPAKPEVQRQRYRTPDGKVASVETRVLTANPDTVQALEPRRAKQGEIAGRLARRLDSIRQETITRLRNLPQGRLDRRRIVAAMSGRQDVRTQLRVEDATGMAVSLLLDQSGSMAPHISSGRLYDATGAIGQALEQLHIPYEVRGHGGYSTQYKAMDDSTLDPVRAARLTSDNTQSNEITAPVVGLATASLLARPDQNRLIVNLMDGDMEDHTDTVTQYREARAQGIVTFGVFLGDPTPGQGKKMTELFGKGNWRQIRNVTELPQVVGQRIADIFDALGGNE
ncbi:MAG TPA: hypothetical protein VFS21_07205 [Roseiflexaceae bacterium]|nr:hypothetical protein [Roseiflexaceae bacterium]